MMNEAPALRLITYGPDGFDETVAESLSGLSVTGEWPVTWIDVDLRGRRLRHEPRHQVPVEHARAPLQYGYPAVMLMMLMMLVLVITIGMFRFLRPSPLDALTRT